MNKEYQIEMNKNWDVVLYFNRTIGVPPTEPTFEDVKQKNTEKSVDELLDIFSELKSNYQKELVEYEKTKIEGTVSSFVFFPFDETFIGNVKNYEKNSFFINWTDSTKNLIKETVIKLSNK